MTVAEQLIKKGVAEGRAEGLIKGELIGDIRIAQLKKGMPVSAKEELEKLSTEELQRRLKDLS
jgi:flagellar biosynthesis/type III secretory pathway protein FliH